jgi:hypothetical protein
MGGLNLYVFNRNDAISRYDLLGLNPFVAAAGKCTMDFVFRKLMEGFDKWDLGRDLEARIDALAGADVVTWNTARWCKGFSFDPFTGFVLDEQTLLETAAGCLFGALRGRQIDKILKNIDDRTLKKWLKKLFEDLSALTEEDIKQRLSRRYC